MDVATLVPWAPHQKLTETVSVPLLSFGDTDGNRAVNVADLTLFRTVFGAATADSTFDVNGDGVINGLDLTAFRAHFGVVL